MGKKISSSQKSVNFVLSAGFTLIELMVVIAVIAVVIAAAVPAVNDYKRKHAIRYASNELYGDIQLARLRAAKNNRRCRIVFNDPANNRYTCYDVDNNGSLLGSYKTGDLTKFHGRIIFTNSPSSSDSAPMTVFEFMPQGTVDLTTLMPVSSNSVYLTNKDNVFFYRVLVSAAGATSIDQWSSSDGTWK
ncbi:MAG: prepilin-type N-terminal cleavage/methylation domain-containing protein [Desulfobacteraceae bacterium]|nr:prepilin-type N-terminal cleavage/methylation domain-containing protein [Desulfobacteraceae bacterium]